MKYVSLKKSKRSPKNEIKRGGHLTSLVKKKEKRKVKRLYSPPLCGDMVKP